MHSERDYLVDNTQAVGLNIVTRLREWLKDCFFNLEAGIDYPTKLGSFYQKKLLDNDIRNIILQSEDVIDITEFESNFDKIKRVYEFNARVLSIYSDETIPIIFNTEDIING